MGHLLHLETATKNCSVAIGFEGHCIALVEAAAEGFLHAEQLHHFVEQAMQEAQIDWSQLKAVAVSGGPGSYTGLRIGVAAAKGYAFALQLPLLAIDTLAVLAAQLPRTDGTVIALMDARRMEVYAAAFQNGQMIEPSKPLIIEPDAFQRFDGPIHLIGDGQQKCQGVLTHPSIHWHEKNNYPSARELCALAWPLFEQQAFVDLAYFEPFYLKPFMGPTTTP